MPNISPRAILSAEEREMIATYMSEQTQIPFDLAAQITGLDADLLRKLVRDGVIDGVAPVRSNAGTCNIDQARDIAARLDAARKPVEGHGILATDVASKYAFSYGSIYRWCEAGWVRVVSVVDGNRLFNEGDIAVARVIADMIGQKPGKAIFPYRSPTGRPPKNKK